MQFLLEGLRADQSALYVTFSESRRELEGVATSHGWDIAKMAMFDLSATESLFRLEAQNTVFHSSEIELTETTQALLRAIEKADPARLAIDSVSELRLLAGSDLRFRRQLLFLKTYFAQRGITVLLIDDLADPERSHTLQSLAHGVVGLERLTPEFGANRRRLSVLKLRGSSFIEGYHNYAIRAGGIVVFPRVTAASGRRTVEPKLLSSGLPPLDALLKGGLDAGTSTLLVGPAGCGKSTVAMQFVHAAAQRGERACIFLFDENLHSYHLRARSMNLALDEGVFAEHINVQQIDPAEMSIGEFAHIVYSQVEGGVSIIVIDSLNGYLQASPGERHITLHLHELLSYLSQHGVLTITVLAQQGMIGSMAMQRPGTSAGPRFGLPWFGTCGSSCGPWPTPWPTSSRTTLKPARSTTAWIAAPMSPRWFPGTAAAMPARSAASVAASSRFELSGTSPIGTVTAESVW